MTTEQNTLHAVQQAEKSRDAPRVSLVVPCYNEEDSLSHFFDVVVPILEEVSYGFEIVCVDDGSVDDTLPRLIALRENHPQLRVVSLSRNFGKEAALSAGLEVTRGDAVIPIDVDLQDPPELIRDFVQRWRNGADVVVGVRADRSSDSAAKRLFAVNFYRVFNAMSELPIPSRAGDYRLMDRRVVEQIKKMPERQRFTKGIFHWVGFRQEYVEFTRAPRHSGSGKWGSWKLWNFALDGIFSFSTAPLRIWTYVGGAMALIAFLYAVYLVVRTLIFGIDVPGYASVAALLLISIALNLISVGLLGEYVGRIYMEVKGRPLYIVALDTGNPEENRDAAILIRT
ncbi:glycosyltransferase family 2 protein [uncultured Roseobacter sp.]|uniref:glycosyltransferase family 2 protein n=1 Tax=uncultured Roseobacter sp. TaxID=114847 RepID=UPI0026194B5E|nr:glycosyltransferase family 2 protein [uncultured Roseobacter sp.]